MKKNKLRKGLLAVRQAQGEIEKEKKDRAILRRLERLSEFQRVREFFTYLAHKGEVSTDPLIKKYLDKKIIVVPKIPKRGRALCLFELHSPEHLKSGKFGIREPVEHCLLKREWKNIGVALVPGIAFDKTGHRIGFGGGYFDRFIKRLRLRSVAHRGDARASSLQPSRSRRALAKKLHCTTIGLAYEFQIIDKVPVGRYDVPVDFIVTEKRLIPCQRYRRKIQRSTRSSGRK